MVTLSVLSGPTGNNVKKSSLKQPPPPPQQQQGNQKTTQHPWLSIPIIRTEFVDSGENEASPSPTDTALSMPSPDPSLLSPIGSESVASYVSVLREDSGFREDQSPDHSPEKLITDDLKTAAKDRKTAPSSPGGQLSPGLVSRKKVTFSETDHQPKDFVSKYCDIIDYV